MVAYLPIAFFNNNGGNWAACKGTHRVSHLAESQPALPSNTLITMTEKKRYSDEELEEFKQIILSKLELAKRDYQQMMDTLSNKNGNDVDDTMPTYKILEEGSMTQTKEELTTMAARQQKFIQALQAALVRIENKTYGICRVTGKLIPKERLRAVPHATLSIEAKQAR